MASQDKITQLQRQLSVIVSTMIDSVGILQDTAPPVPIGENFSLQAETSTPLNDPSNINSHNNNNNANNTNNDNSDVVMERAVRLGEDFVEACLNFEKLLDELPRLTKSDQLRELRRLDERNVRGTEELVQCTSEAQALLSQISHALKQISNHHFHIEESDGLENGQTFEDDASMDNASPGGGGGGGGSIVDGTTTSDEQRSWTK